MHLHSRLLVTITLTLTLCGQAMLPMKTKKTTPQSSAVEAAKPMLKHLAIIPDGNRRWAKKNKLKAIRGHKKGFETFQNAFSFCVTHNIQHLSLYAFSLENQNRSKVEKAALFKILTVDIMRQLPDLKKNGIKVRFIGNRKLFPSNLIPSINEVEATTKGGTTLQVNLLFFYGGQQEIVAATTIIAKMVQQGRIDPEDITEETFRRCLWVDNDIPDPDLVIRTSGISRFSNYFTFQSAYSEFMVLDKLWPDVQEEDLEACLEKFTKIKRNFGS